jgi:two-component system nitrate/nitrite response regulator NarL
VPGLVIEVDQAVPAAFELQVVPKRQRVTAPTVTIAHTESLVADILAEACRRQGLRVGKVVGSARELLDISERQPADIVLLTVDLGGVAAEEIVSRLVSSGSRVVILSPLPAPERLLSLLALGVHGFHFYDASPEEIGTGVRAVARGGFSISATAAGLLVHHWRGLLTEGLAADGPSARALTAREREVLRAMAEGMSTKAVARTLQIAVKTVENHKIRIFEKLGVRTHAQAVVVATTNGLIPITLGSDRAADGPMTEHPAERPASQRAS